MKALATVNFMSLTFVSRTSLPELSRGAAGKESVTVHENGQLVLSSKAIKVLGIEDAKETLVVLGFDTATRSLVIAVATPKLVKAVGGEAGCYKLRGNKKTKQGVFAASAFLQDPNDEIFGGNKYLYRESGNQTFDATVDEKNKTVTCTLPSGKLTKKDVVKRPKKVAPAPPANTAPTGNVPATPINKSESKDDELEDLEIPAA